MTCKRTFLKCGIHSLLSSSSSIHLLMSVNSLQSSARLSTMSFVGGHKGFRTKHLNVVAVYKKVMSLSNGKPPLVK